MTMLTDSVRQLAAALVVFGLLIAALVLGQVILIPLAGAAIVSFILAPVVRRLAALRVPHAIAVGTVLAFVLASLVAVTVLLSGQLLSITASISDYNENITRKVRAVAVIGADDGSLKRAVDAIGRLGDAVVREFNLTTSGAASTSPEDAPIVVKTVENTSSATIARLSDFLEPLAMFALLLLFTLFLLLQHQDIRDRIVRLFGTDNLSDTTSAMAEAGKRLSKLFLAQALLSASYGAIVGLTLWAVGLPGALLWGVLSGLMRFVPFIGSFIAAVPPIFVAAGVDPGWGLALFTATLFIVGEAVMGNLVEPHILGRRVGLSPFAMIVAASFWTLIWGPVGLLLAAPLTIALVVLGRHIHGLSFLSVLLGDEPALEPAQELYHRLLSGDALAAAGQLEGREGVSLSETSDALVLPALALASADSRIGRLSQPQATVIRETLHDAVDLLPAFSGPEPVSEPNEGAGILLVAARGEIDIALAAYLARTISVRAGREAEAVEHATGLTALTAAISDDGDRKPTTIVIATAGEMPSRHLQFIAARAMRAFPDARVMVFAPGSEAETTVAKEANSVTARHFSTVRELLANLRIEISEQTSQPSGNSDLQPA